MFRNDTKMVTNRPPNVTQLPEKFTRFLSTCSLSAADIVRTAAFVGRRARMPHTLSNGSRPGRPARL